ncbi:Protein kinase-like superfamily protein [Klebsormidium nitens]|uniref:Protein kinase-like superfamily protein n=1 Tax=Klebsormidium nitens TaxID=105231 RepID=A0A1Y1I7K2_KLENI|nr:Protein kinase-like superfamily protein [Klebsormidium nitens]|eukprot:GAQ86945.1 Protein kinase-like superfamily protein [Klebsormidium nitens]
MSGNRVHDFASSPRSVLHEDIEKGPKDVVTGRRIKKSYRTPKTATDPEEIQVTGDFVDETGHELANGWVLGKKLGQGMQGSIYLLKDKEGNDAGRVFKEVNNKKAGKATGNLVGLEREWAIGRKLNLLDEDDGFLEGFMQTGSKVLDKDGSFMGMVLEKLNGGDVLKRLEDTKFNDVDYILAMVMQVLRALNRAHHAIGFRHGDMRIHNVMEHFVTMESNKGDEPAGPDNFGERVDLRGLHFKIIDYGHAVAEHEKATDHDKRHKAQRFHMPKIPTFSLEKVYRWVFREKGDVWRFMRSIGQACEGRVWRKQDALKVKLLLRLISKTTGYHHSVQFADSKESGEQKKSLIEKLLSVGSRLFFFKWLNIMLRAYIFPGHPTMSAAEALQYMQEQRDKIGLSEREFPCGTLAWGANQIG